MRKAILLTLFTLWAALAGTHAQTCDENVQLNAVAFAVNISITTCIECAPDGIVQRNVQWDAGGLLMSGQNGVTITNGVLVVTSEFFTGRANPFDLTCFSPNAFTEPVYRAGFFPPTVSMPSVSVTEGDGLTILCTHSNLPSSITQQWLDPQGGVAGIFPNLVLSNLQRGAAGEYRCVLTRISSGATLYAPAIITVTYPTTITSNSPSQQFIAMDGTLTRSCTYDSVPASTVTWRFNGAVLSTMGNVMISESGSTSTLTRSPLASNEGGVYECVASNTLANGMVTTSTPISFTVTVQVPPGTATSLMVSNIQETSVFLSWVNGDDGMSAITGVTVEVLIGTTSISSNFLAGSSVMSYIVSNLMPFTTYEFRVTVDNAIGPSAAAIKTATTLSLVLPAPTVVSLTPLSSTRLRVEWTFTLPSTTDAPSAWAVQLLDSADMPIGNDTVIQDGAARAHEFSGLARGTLYKVRVAGRNIRGMGPFSPLVANQTDIDPPGMPTAVTTTVLSAFAFRLSWEPPANGDDGGSPITQYIIRVIANGVAQEITHASVNERMRLLRDNGDSESPIKLNSSTSYGIEVVAVNSAGRGMAGVTTVMTQSTEEPQPILDIPTSSQVTNLTAGVSWIMPREATVNTYLVQLKLRAGDWTNSADVTNITVFGNMTSLTLMDLTPEAAYDVRVFTVNDRGTSLVSPLLQFTTLPPSPPIVAGPTRVPFGEGARINCSSTVETLRLQWVRITAMSDGDTTDSDLPGTARQTIQPLRNDLIFSSPTVMDTGRYACQIGATVRMQHSIEFEGPPGTTGISLPVIIIVSVVGGVVLLVFVGVVFLAICCICCSGNKSKTSYTVKTVSKSKPKKTQSKAKSKGKKSNMTWIETSAKFPSANPSYSRTTDEPSFDMPDDLQAHSSFTLEKQNRVNQ